MLDGGVTRTKEKRVETIVRKNEKQSQQHVKHECLGIEEIRSQSVFQETGNARMLTEGGVFWLIQTREASPGDPNSLLVTPENDHSPALEH